MKNILTTFIIATALITITTGCKGKDSVVNDPKAVVVAFFEKMSRKDLDGASKLATKESKATIDMMKKGMDMAENMKDGMNGTVKEKDETEKFKNMQFGEAKIDGNNATVSIVNPASDKGEKAFDFPLKKEGGDWKVDFNLGTLMKMGMSQTNKTGFGDMDKTDTDTAGVSDRIKGYLNTDSLKQAMEQLDSMMKTLDPEKVKQLKEAMKIIEKTKEN